MGFASIRLPIITFFMALVFAACGYLEAYAAMASGVTISPPRQEIKDGQRYATIAILNRAKDAAVSYKISLVSFRMQQNGKLVAPEVPTKREQIAASMIKFSPRQAVIPANGKQTVRILVRRPAGLPDGEYLTYMRVTPSVQVDRNENAPAKPTDKLSMSLKTVIGMSSPIIIYQGDPTSTSKIAGATLGVDEYGNRAIKVFIERSGNKSSYPGIEIYSTSGGEKKLIAKRRRIPIFLPLKRRTEFIRLKKDVSFTGGPVLIEMTDFEDPDKGIIDTFKVNL